jgi:tetratricopeptide (TPR) repeat protein
MLSAIVMPTPDPQQFIDAVRPALQKGDAQGVSAAIQQLCRPHELCGLLRHSDLEVRKTAVVVLGLVGDRSVIGCLTRCLHDDDHQVHQFAEDALWSIWFRCGNAEATRHFHEGLLALAEEELDRAAACFVRSTEADPDYAEAYNQLAIAHYLRQDWLESMIACRQTLALMPTHFGALAGLGHVYAHRGELTPAVDCYRRALAINPHMSSIAQAKAKLEKRLALSATAPTPTAGTSGLLGTRAARFG